MLFNPTALRKAKIVYNFGLSKCNRDKQEDRFPHDQNYFIVKCTHTKIYYENLDQTTMQGCTSDILSSQCAMQSPHDKAPTPGRHNNQNGRDSFSREPTQPFPELPSFLTWINS